MAFTHAVRKSVSTLTAMIGTSGSGKTYSALLFAAGLAGPKGRVGMIDTENGRGSMYADSAGIVTALPGGYEISQMDPPFDPDRYIAEVKEAERAGIDVLLIDSATHEWEGIGGCAEIAETKKLGGMPNWSLAKRKHKLFVNTCLSSKMHIVFCLRARDKVKMVKRGDRVMDGQIETDQVYEKDSVIPLGIQPVCEKSFVFEMLLSLMLDERTHHAVPIKCPEPLLALFPGRRLVTKADGERVREWNASGAAMSGAENIRKRARLAAENGVEAYREYYMSLTAIEKKQLAGAFHEECKQRAAEVDAAETTGVIILESIPEQAADYPPNTRISVLGRMLTNGDELTGWSPC